MSTPDNGENRAAPAGAPPANAGEGSLLSSPIIRVTLVVVAVAIVLVIVGFVALSAMASARKRPPDIDIYPGARLEGQLPLAAGHDRLTYTVVADVEDVVRFYRERYNRDEDQYCVRIENAAYAEDPSLPAFEVRCGYDNSTINAHQSATITVQPHTSGQYAGRTVISIERFWQQ